MCNYVQTTGNAGNFPESPGTSKILTSFWFPENANDIKGRNVASQAYDEGSIPFTRSSEFLASSGAGGLWRKKRNKRVLRRSTFPKLVHPRLIV